MISKNEKGLVVTKTATRTDTITKCLPTSDLTEQSLLKIYSIFASSPSVLIFTGTLFAHFLYVLKSNNSRCHCNCRLKTLEPSISTANFPQRTEHATSCGSAQIQPHRPFRQSEPRRPHRKTRQVDRLVAFCELRQLSNC